MTNVPVEQEFDDSQQLPVAERPQVGPKLLVSVLVIRQPQRREHWREARLQYFFLVDLLLV
jgi:hypothetical protein